MCSQCTAGLAVQLPPPTFMQNQLGSKSTVLTQRTCRHDAQGELPPGDTSAGGAWSGGGQDSHARAGLWGAAFSTGFHDKFCPKFHLELE